VKRTFTLAFLLGTTACSMAPKYVQGPLPVPASWPIGDAYLRQVEAALPAISYRDVFRDARLQAIIEQALVNNRDLRIAAANIASARAQYRIQRANQLPQIDLSTDARVSDSGSGTSSTGGTGTGIGNTGSTNTRSGVRTTYSADIGVTSFELDLFGRIASLTRAQQERYFATEAAARATRTALIGDIADAWLTYGSDISLLKIAQDTAANAERSVRLTRARLEGGIAPRTDLRQAEQVLFTAQADLAEQRTALAQDVNALQLLVGASIDPALLPRSISEAAGTVAELAPGLDSRILLRRPDVLQAEFELRAANAEIGAARAALFPRISLTGVLGLASDALGALFTGGAFNFSGGANLGYPIFSGGAGRAGVALTQAQRDAALASYERAIQIAFREVSDGLARRGTIAEQTRATRALVASATDNFALANARYRGGIDTFLSSLDAQRSLYSAQRTLVSTELTGASNLVSLYRALGGDAATESVAIRASETPRPAGNNSP
jgi:outer membrane protein, multidrug efflux system